MAQRRMARKRSNITDDDSVRHEEYMVLRTVYLPASLDFKLRKRAERENKSKNEIIRELLATTA